MHHNIERAPKHKSFAYYGWNRDGARFTIFRPRNRNQQWSAYGSAGVNAYIHADTLREISAKLER